MTRALATSPPEEGPGSRRNSKRGARARRQGIVLLLALAGLQAGLMFLGSGRGFRLFSAAEPVVDLDTLATGLERAGDGSIVLRAGERPSIARLGGFVPEPGKSYLIRLRANPGLVFNLQMIDRAAERATRTWEVPARARSIEQIVVIEDWALAPANRLEIRNPTAGDLVVYELGIHRLSPAHSLLGRALVPLGLLLVGLYGWRWRALLRAHFGAGPRLGWLDGVVAGFFALVCLHLFLDAPVIQLLDSKFSTAVSHQVLTAGELALPDNFLPAQRDNRPYQLQEVSGRLYHFYPDAVAVLNVPLVAIFEALGIAPVGDGGLFLRHHEVAILAVAAALQAAAICALFFLLGRVYLPPAPALGLAALFAFGTQIYSSVSRPYWSHAWALLLLTTAIYVLVAPALRERRWAVVAAATCLSWAFFCRPPISLAIVGVTGYLLWARRRHFVLFAVTGALWAALFAAYSLHHFDQPFPPYFLTRHLETGVLGLDTLRSSYPTAAFGTLFAASRGLFVYVPFLLLVLWLAARHRNRLADRPLAFTAVAVILGHWQLLSSNRSWGGGQSFGPRLFADTLVWFLLLAAMALPPEWRSRPRQRRVLTAAKAALALVLVAVALFINIRGAHSRETFIWRQPSYLDWSSPQFLAGLGGPRQPPPLGERLLELRQRPSPAAREAALDAILADTRVAKRWIEPEKLFAVFATWDAWTFGDALAAVVALNPEAETMAPRLRLATWAEPDVYPITVSVEDGVQTHRHTLAAPGQAEIDLAPVEPGSRRLYLVWSDKGWTPGGSDTRELGVQLLPVK